VNTSPTGGLQSTSTIIGDLAMGREETTTSEYHERSAERAAAAMTKKTGLGGKDDGGKQDKKCEETEEKVEVEESGSGSRTADHLALGDGK
jgi:hypothetical protein